MDIDAFLNLLSLHILPSHFVRIRHYGILSPCNRAKLRCIQQQLEVPPVPKVRNYSAAEVQPTASYLLCRDEAYIVNFLTEAKLTKIASLPSIHVLVHHRS